MAEGLSRRMSLELLTRSLERARHYRITTLETVERIAWLYLQQGTAPLPPAEVDILLIDEIGYVEVEPVQVGLFFTLMHQRHKKKSTGVPFSKTPT